MSIFTLHEFKMNASNVVSFIHMLQCVVAIHSIAISFTLPQARARSRESTYDVYTYNHTQDVVDDDDG